MAAELNPINRPLPVRAPIEVRWRDLDPMGHVNNAVFATYFEMSRVHYWKALGNEIDFHFILARLEIDFKSPILLTDTVEVQIGVTEIGRSSFVFQYQLVKGNDEVAAIGRSIQVSYDYSQKKSRPLSEEIVKKIRALEHPYLDK